MVLASKGRKPKRISSNLPQTAQKLKQAAQILPKYSTKNGGITM
jgi:hypothetical protein